LDDRKKIEELYGLT